MARTITGISSFARPLTAHAGLKAMEIRPGDKRLVHHANVLVDRQQNGRRMESEPGAGSPAWN